MHAHSALQQHTSVLLPDVRKAAVCPLTQDSQPVPALTKGQKAEGLMSAVCLTMHYDPTLIEITTNPVHKLVAFVQLGLLRFLCLQHSCSGRVKEKNKMLEFCQWESSF